MAEELKACPFCRGKNLSVGRWGNERITVACEPCDFDGPEGLSAEDAADKWNTRAQPSQGGEAVEAVAKVVTMGLGKHCAMSYGDAIHQCEPGEPLMTVAQHQRIMAASVGSAEPVAWMDEDGCLHTTLDSAQFRGKPVTPLYTHPAGQVAKHGAVDVSRELLLEIRKSERRGVDWAQEIDAALSAKP